MTTFYLAVFVIGFALTAITFLTGVAGDAFGHFGGAGHGGDWGHGTDGAHGHGGHGRRSSFLNLGTIAAFMTWFGGIGFLIAAYSTLVAAVTLVLAVSGGMVGAGIIFLFMARVLAPDQTPLNPADYYLPGTLGRVTVTIPNQGTGEIVYTQGGTRKTVAARAVDGAAIVKGTEVVVLRYEHGIAYTRAWDPVADERPGSR